MSSDRSLLDNLRAEDEGFILFNLGNSPFFRKTSHKSKSTGELMKMQ